MASRPQPAIPKHLEVLERASLASHATRPEAPPWLSPWPTSLPGLGLMVVTAEDRARWHQPIIYAWVRGDEVPYIGCSWRGIERPMGVGHEKLRDFQPGDQVRIWAPALDGPALSDLEDTLIRRCRPRHNKPNGGTPCPDCGGRWKLRDRPAGRCWWCEGQRAAGRRPILKTRRP